MFAKNEKEKLIDLVETFGPLTKNELAAYFKLTKGKDPEETKYIINRLETNNQIFTKEEIVKASPGASIKTKRILAFWIYLAFVKECEETTFKAKYPSEIGFVNNDVFVIAICEDGSRDREMISLREKEKDDVTYIIGGLNMAVDEIKEDLLPKNSFIYAEIRINDLLTETPKITFKKINKK